MTRNDTALIYRTFFPKGRKHFGKRRKYWLPAFSSCPTMFSEIVLHRVVKSCDKSMWLSGKRDRQNIERKGENANYQHFLFSKPYFKRLILHSYLNLGLCNIPFSSLYVYLTPGLHRQVGLHPFQSGLIISKVSLFSSVVIGGFTSSF